MAEPAKFVPFQAFVDPALWAEIGRRRLDEWQLESPTVSATASYSIFGRQIKDCALTFGHESLQVDSTSLSDRRVHINGLISVTGTLKEFKSFDRKNVLETLRDKVWKSITSEKALRDPSILNAFYFLAFADLKNYVYTSTICIPALLFPADIKASTTALNSDEFKMAIDHFSSSQIPVFLIVNGTVKSFEYLKGCENSEVLTLVFADPSSVKGYPGWPLRNLIAAVAYYRPKWSSVQVMALRGLVEETDVYNISWNVSSLEKTPDGVGWSKVESVNLKSVFDPKRIMENSVDMNLKLIRWRLVPTLKLPILSQLRVLIIGAGTLGCNLARSLLGWGIRNFTFIDNSIISYNNPVRQTLYEFEDCKSGTKFKAPAAAEALKRIFPGVNADGVVMKIPMPGHQIDVSDRAQTAADCERLENLVKNHHAIFLVMDSRESRWLPTVYAAQHQKVAITVALGFDSFVVMRHGIPDYSNKCPQFKTADDLGTPVSGTELGCYYCSDVTAPGNSLDDRTLDQNCTISRAGISGIASGFAVELLMALVQHEEGGRAPAIAGGVDETSSILGATPHQVRGWLSRYQFMTPTVRRYENCVSCSDGIHQEFSSRGFDFLWDVFNNNGILEKLSGLTEAIQAVLTVDLDGMALEETDSDT